MGFNTFGPLLVVDAQLTPAAGVVGTVVDATTEATVQAYNMSGSPISLVTNARGYVGQFQAPDTSVMLRLTFGDLALDVVAKEVIAAGGGGTGGVTSVDGQTGAVSLSSTYVAQADPASVAGLSPTTDGAGGYSWEPGGGGGGVTDHGALSGLADDDHTQYALADGSRGSFAATSHTHPVSQISDSTVTGRALITAATATAARTAISAAPALGSDDNYVTDAEKAALHTHPAVIAQGATQADARAAIGAGTSSFSGAYTDLSGKPSLFSGSYTDLTNKPTIPDSADDIGAAPATQTLNAQTGTYTLVAGDAGKLVTMSKTAAMDLTIPKDVFSAGQRVDVLVTNTGMVTVKGATGVTVTGTPSLVSRAQWSALTVICTASNTFVAVGDLATP